MTSGRRAATALAVVGLGVSAYLTVVHFAQGQVPLFCTTTGAINCEQVTTSPQSMIGPAPVALLGLIWFVVMLGLVALPNVQSFDVSVSVPLAWSGAGLLFVFYLIYAELFLIGRICLWCTAVHALVIALFMVCLYEYLAQIESPELTPAPRQTNDRSKSRERAR